MNNNKFSYLVKFVIVGESGVGKSCLVLNFTERKPRKQHQITIACEFASRIVTINGTRIKIQIWDTAGQENFRSITRGYYRASVAAVIVYDLSSRKSFERVKDIWMNELKENASSEIKILLVGNKKDLENHREVSYEEGMQFAKVNGLKFVETCAFELSSIEPVFLGLAEDILEDINSGRIDPEDELTGVKIGPLNIKFSKRPNRKLMKESNSGIKKKKKKKGCC